MSEPQRARMKAEIMPMSAADISESDIEAVLAVMRSGRLALGPETERFEAAIADYVGVPHALAVSSGTAALHLMVKALGIGPGDEVLVPSFTFAASVNALLYEGARPVFVDIDPDVFNLDLDDVERRITRRTRAIMAVDVFGHPARWDALTDLAQKHGLKLIDDSCEALGAEYRGRRLGTFGDAAAFAFYPNKQMTTGEGGIIVTADPEVARLCRSLRNQGRSEMGSWLEHERLGYNYRIDELSAALGVSQMQRIEELLRKRDQVAGNYNRQLASIPWLRTPHVHDDVRISWFVYVVLLAEGLHRDDVMEGLGKIGIPSRAYFSPIHRQAYMSEYIDSIPDLPITDAIASRTLALPFHGNMTETDIKRVAEGLAYVGEQLQ